MSSSTNPEQSSATVRCPFCKEIIKANAIKCYHCGSMLTMFPPQQNGVNAAPAGSYPAQPGWGMSQNPAMYGKRGPRYSTESFNLFLVLHLVPYILAVLINIGFVIKLFVMPPCPPEMEIINLFFSYGGGICICSLLSSIFMLFLLYHCWNVIQDGQTRTTPGQAIGFLFIPLFNLYWVFVCFGGLANSLNNYISRYQLPVRKCSSGLVKTAVAFLVIGCFFTPVLLIVFLLFPFAAYTLMRTAKDIQKYKLQTGFGLAQ